VPVLSGYPYRFIRNLARHDSRGFWSRNNPAMVPYIFCNKSRYVLIHGYDTLSSWYVYFAALWSRKIIIWRGETIESKEGGWTLTKFIKALVLPLYFRGCSTVLYSCISNYECLEKYVPKHKLVSFPCAVDNDFFQKNRIEDADELRELRLENGLPEDHMVIASCSRLTKRKRIDLNIKAIAKMRDRNVSLLLIGDGPERETLQAMANSLGVNVVVTGFVGQVKVAKLFSVVDVFVLLSSYDASPKALNEAMSFPIPLVVSDGVGTARDLVREGINGYIYRDGEEDALVEYFNQFAENPDTRVEMGRENANLLKNYSFDTNVLNLVNAIMENA